jgi:hypothetical protein
MVLLTQIKKKCKKVAKTKKVNVQGHQLLGVFFQVLPYHKGSKFSQSKILILILRWLAAVGQDSYHKIT